jgi:DNA-binding NarL/FixJ family response regulator
VKRGADLVSIIEAAYRLDLADHEWTLSVARAAAPLLDDGHGLAAYFVDTSGQGPVVHSPAFVGTDPWNGAWRARWWDARVARMPVKLVADLAGFGGATWASQSCGAVMRGAFVERLARDVPPMPLPRGVSEALVVSGFDPSGAGAVLFAFREGSPATSEHPRTLRRVASHLATAVRLRRRRTEGRVVRAPAVDRARTRRHRSQPDVLERWLPLHEGVAIVPTERGYLAFESSPDGVPLERLTPRERAVTALVALGRSNKSVAYELGVRPSTVSTLLSSAARKLAVEGVGGIIGRARDAVQVQPRAVGLARERGLTEAEAAVLCLLFAGLRDAEIAALRVRTRATITKQIDAIYKKLGVQSRRELLSSFAPWPVAAGGAKVGA